MWSNRIPVLMWVGPHVPGGDSESGQCDQDHVDPDELLIISADAAASHQSVVLVMEAARRAGLSHITFATQSASTAGKR